MIANRLLPWHVDQWKLLREAKLRERLHHAQLLVGGCDVEKKSFAEKFAALLLCQSNAGESCAHCHSCQLVLAGSHPDFFMIEPDEVGHSIKIDQIRELVEKINETSQQGGYKVVIISPAHAMTMAAANALLKSLEEPPAKTLIFLMSDQALRLPATIRSRCQALVFKKPPTEEALQWLSSQMTSVDPAKYSLLLHLAEGWPLKALALGADDIMAMRQEIYEGLLALSRGEADPLKCAAKWQEYDIIAFLKLMLVWLRDMLRYSLLKDSARLINSDFSAALSKITISSEHLLAYLDLVQERYTKVINAANLNKQLLAEELLIHWVHYVSR